MDFSSIDLQSTHTFVRVYCLSQPPLHRNDISYILTRYAARSIILVIISISNNQTNNAVSIGLCPLDETTPF